MMSVGVSVSDKNTDIYLHVMSYILKLPVSFPILTWLCKLEVKLVMSNSVVEIPSYILITYANLFGQNLYTCLFRSIYMITKVKAPPPQVISLIYSIELIFL